MFIGVRITHKHAQTSGWQWNYLNKFVAILRWISFVVYSPASITHLKEVFVTAKSEPCALYIISSVVSHMEHTCCGAV